MASERENEKTFNPFSLFSRVLIRTATFSAAAQSVSQSVRLCAAVCTVQCTPDIFQPLCFCLPSPFLPSLPPFFTLLTGLSFFSSPSRQYNRVGRERKRVRQFSLSFTTERYFLHLRREEGREAMSKGGSHEHRGEKERESGDIDIYYTCSISMRGSKKWWGKKGKFSLFLFACIFVQCMYFRMCVYVRARKNIHKAGIYVVHTLD